MNIFCEGVKLDFTAIKQGSLKQRVENRTEPCGAPHVSGAEA